MIGSNNGAHDFKDHPFFQDIDWKRLYNKQVTPSFIPITSRGELSLDNIEQEFVDEAPTDTPAPPNAGNLDPNFEAFTFEGQNRDIRQ